MVTAAACLLVASAVIYFRPHRTDSTMRRSGPFTAVAPAGQAAEPPAEFQWNPLPGAAKYELKLMDADRAVVWIADTTHTSIAVPINIRLDLRPARPYAWQVTARGAKGENLGATNLQSFHIAVTTK